MDAQGHEPLLRHLASFTVKVLLYLRIEQGVEARYMVIFAPWWLYYVLVVGAACFVGEAPYRPRLYLRRSVGLGMFLFALRVLLPLTVSLQLDDSSAPSTWYDALWPIWIIFAMGLCAAWIVGCTLTSAMIVAERRGGPLPRVIRVYAGLIGLVALSLLFTAAASAVLLTNRLNGGDTEFTLVFLPVTLSTGVGTAILGGLLWGQKRCAGADAGAGGDGGDGDGGGGGGVAWGRVGWRPSPDWALHPPLRGPADFARSPIELL